MKKIRFFIEFRMLHPISFALYILYIGLIICAIIRELYPEQPVMSVGIIIYACWFVFFCIRAFIASSLHRFSNYVEQNVKTDIIIEDIVRIRTGIYHKVLMKLNFETTGGQVYYGKYICDPLYFETYLKSQLRRKLDIDISIWHNKKNNKYFIDVRKVMKEVAGVEKPDYRGDFLKGQPVKVNPVLLIFILLLLIDMFLMVISFADSDFERFPVLLGIFVVLAFALYLTANKES